MKTGENLISELLWKFSEKTIKKLKQYKKDGGLEKDLVTYEVGTVSKFEYKDGNISHTTGLSLENREILSWANQFRYIDNELKTLKEYSEIVNTLAEYYDESSFWADFHLMQYTHDLVRKAVKKVSKESLHFGIVQFMRVLDKSPKRINIRAWVDGILIDAEEYVIHKNVKLRRLQKSDLEYENPLYPTTLHKKPPQATPAILEMWTRSVETREAQEELDLVLSILRLFRVGCVYSHHSIFAHESNVLGGTFTTGGKGRCSLRYNLCSHDVERLSAFIDTMYSVTPSELKRVGSEDVAVTDIAFDRYNDGILRAHPIEASIASSIACIEALLFHEDEQSEMARTLAQRVASLLQHFEQDPVQVYNKMKSAYDIRSRYVHGGLVKKERRQKLGDLRRSILNFARICLVVCLQIDNEKRKSMISQLDNSLLSDKAKERVLQSIGNLVVPLS